MSTLKLLEKHDYKKVCLIPTLSSQNVDDAISVIKFAKDKGFKPALGLVDLDKSNELSLKNLSSEERSKLSNALELILKKEYVQFYEKLADNLIDNTLNIKMCTFACNNVVIDTDGNVFPCFHRRECLGNISDGFKTISNNQLKFLSENPKNFNCATTACFSLL